MGTTAKPRWTWTHIAAAVAFVLGAVAVVGSPYQGHKVTLDTKELAVVVSSEVDHVTPQDLAGWIIEGNTEYRLIDLRQPSAFADYHIPTAEHVPLAQLPDYPLPRNENIVLYSDGGIHSAQAWFLMKAQGYRGAYMLLGGLDAWKEEVLFPALAAEATPQQAAEFERLRFVSQFFGGTPRSAVTERVDEIDVPMPTVEKLEQPVVTVRQKRKKEGC